VTDLRATLTIVHDSAKALHASGISAAQEAYQILPQFIDKTEKVVNDLVCLIEQDLLKSPGKVSYRAWNDKNKKRLAVIKESISEARLNLTAVIASANLYVFTLSYSLYND
jgi:hypothetical protein